MIRKRNLIATALFAVVAGLSVPAMAQVQVDSRLPNYTPTGGVSGAIKSVGSDTMNNLQTLWGEKYVSFYPNVPVEIEGKGSSTAPPALIAGSSNFGPMSRSMKDKEIDEFEKRYGYKPTALRTSIDMLAVYVHKDNPIAKTGLSLEQLDGIFSKTRKSGAAEITTWGQLGLTGEWASKPISLYGRNSASGTYGYFKDHALFKGDYKDSVKEQPGSASVVQGVASDKYGIGYSGIGYRTADVAVVPLAHKSGEKAVPAEPNNVSEYPLARFLYLNVNYKPGSKLDPLRAEYLKLVFSKQGQEVVIKDGYLPVSYNIAKQDLSNVGINIDTDY
ncbi:MAG: phosphate ABC transporter substrate-binding protein PstS family protein [Phycisphaera sp.]|nr:phosphate ABC transporter substrate-binding protein PstS family protein [Phycisphaera sp.]